MAVTIPYVTNRPYSSKAGFGPPPGPAAAQPLYFGAALINASASAAVDGSFAALAAPPTLASGALLVTFLANALRDAIAANRLPLLTIHGYGYSFGEAVARAADIAACYGADGPPLLCPIAFTWPSVDITSPDAYLADRGLAEASGPAFAQFMQAFAQAWRQAGKPSCAYLAHSMGNWASQNAGLALAGAGLPVMFDHMLLMAPDVDTDALEQGKGLDVMAALARSVTVGINHGDSVVLLDTEVVIRRPRLAWAGPDNPAAIPSNVQIVDYTFAVGTMNGSPPGQTDWNWIGHQYYRTCQAVRSDLRATLQSPPQGLVPGRQTAAELIALGLPGIIPGRLYVRPAVTASNDVNPIGSA